MLSKGGKREYHCPKCNSKNIKKAFTFGSQRCGECLDCNTWWPWTHRIKCKAAE